MKRKLQLLLGIAVLTLGLAGPAHAAVSLNIALTATIQDCVASGKMNLKISIES